MRILFIGAVKFSACALRELIKMDLNIVGVCTLKQSNFNSDHVDLAGIAKSKDIPFQYASDINSEEVHQWISGKLPDIIFCFGWSQLIKNPLLSLPKLGVIGYHPAALPANRGRHPIIWALVLGLSETASTFFFMDDMMDSGDILSQTFIEIKPTDNAASLYDRLTEVAIVQIREFVPGLLKGNIKRTPQSSSVANTWRKRGEEDGCIDWRMAAISINNLVRGLSRPYIGAHFKFKDQRFKVWRTEVVYGYPSNLEPGKVLGSDARGIIVKAGIDAIRLCEIDPNIVLHPGEYL